MPQPKKPKPQVKRESVGYRVKMRLDRVAPPEKTPPARNEVAKLRRGIFRKTGRWPEWSTEPIASIEIRMKFDFRKMQDVKRMFAAVASSEARGEGSRRDAKNLLKALPHCGSLMHKTCRVLLVPKRFWKWNTPEHQSGPAFIFEGCVVIARKGIPKKYLPTILDHEARELLLLRSAFKDSAHRIARRKEKAEWPRGFAAWLKKNYPEAWKARRGTMRQKT